jgi:hypothetical protein
MSSSNTFKKGRKTAKKGPKNTQNERLYTPLEGEIGL